jgi:hypothetical protein
VWFKATPHGSAEPILHQTLDAEIPEYVAPVLAADLGRGWLLIEDAGESLGNDAEAEGTQPCGDPRFQRAMTTYAGLQEQLRHRVDELVTQGLPDARPHALPGVFDQLLASMGRRARDTGDEDASDLLARIAAARPLVVDLAASCSPLARGRSTTTTCTRGTCWSVTVRPCSSTGATRWRRTRTRACWSPSGSR